VEYLRGDRDVVQLWYNTDRVAGTVDVLIENCSINSNLQKVDIRVRPDDTVRILGNHGNAQVMVSTAPKYIWPTNPSWDPSWVLYKGPITQDYSLN